MNRPLVERPAVRRAVVALIKALLHEGGLQVSDLQSPAKGEQGGAAEPVLQAPRQLVTPPPAAKAARVHKPPAWGATQGQVVPGVRAPKIGLPADGVVTIPAGVKVTQCPGVNHDPRYQVDATRFGGGELMRDWAQQAPRG